MKQEHMSMLFAIYRDPGAADGAVAYLKGLNGTALSEVDGAATVAWNRVGRVVLVPLVGTGLLNGATRGAALGAVAGLLFPADFFASPFLGANVSGLSSQVIARGCATDGLREIGSRLLRGQLALIVVGRAATIDRIAGGLRQYDSLARYELDAEFVRAVTERSGGTGHDGEP